jgi:hypothetical protein
MRRANGRLSRRSYRPPVRRLPLLDKLPFRVEAIQTGNQARHPTAERESGASHRIDAEESCRRLNGVLIDDAQMFNDELAEWQDSCAARHPTSDCCKRPPTRTGLRRKRSTSVAHP